MSKWYSYSSIKQWFKNLNAKKFFYLLIPCLLLISLMNLVRSCSNSVSTIPTYRIGRDPHWFFVNLMGKERNMTAFSDELLSAMAKKEKLGLVILSDFSNELLQKLQKGELDGILSPLEKNATNQNHLLFSDPYFSLGPVLILPIESDFNSEQKQGQKMIGIQTSLSNNLNLEKDPTIQIRLYNDILQALADLNTNQIDGVIFPSLPAFIYTKAFYPNRLRIATPPLNEEGLRLITLNNPKGASLIQHFNEGLHKLKQDGGYDELIHKWGLINAEKWNE
jgi:ABC-type amino acid transport substrate-binding protein